MTVGIDLDDLHGVCQDLVLVLGMLLAGEGLLGVDGHCLDIGDGVGMRWVA